MKPDIILPQVCSNVINSIATLIPEGLVTLSHYTTYQIYILHKLVSIVLLLHQMFTITVHFGHNDRFIELLFCMISSVPQIWQICQLKMSLLQYK